MPEEGKHKHTEYPQCPRENDKESERIEKNNNIC